MPYYHISGNGCQKCSYHISEQKVYTEIKKIYNDAIYQYRNKNILKRQSFDIFIPSLNVAIEYQGKQHFIPCNRFGGEKGFKKVIINDKIKKDVCDNNGIKLYYISFENKKILNENVYTDIEILINNIKNENNT